MDTIIELSGQSRPGDMCWMTPICDFQMFASSVPTKNRFSALISIFSIYRWVVKYKWPII